MATSQGWDANLLSHSLKFNHKAIFSLAFVFHLDKFKRQDVYPKPIRVFFPLRLHPFAQQAWLPLQREDLASCVSSLTSTMSFLIPGEDSGCPASCLPRRFLWDYGEITLSFGRHQPQGAFQVSLGGLRGQLRALAWAGRDPSVQNMLCSSYKKAL